MIRLQIKPLSVNKAWQGKRYKTHEYDTWRRTMAILLPNRIDRIDPPYFVRLKFGFSTKAADIDNPVKMVLDSLQYQYDFNDKEIYKLEVEKEIVKKGAEYVAFEILKYEV